MHEPELHDDGDEGFAGACVLAFDSDDLEFARGFEAGRLWSILRERPDEEVSEMIGAGNAEMVCRIADSLGRVASITSASDDPMLVVFTPAEERA